MAKVLVVEENPSVVTSILVQLKLAGHLARAMENLQAAETLINEARVDRFDAIIYNPLLSSLDGYALLSDLKNHEETKDIPVIGYSEELDQLSKQRFRDLGAEC
ncbi:response regulator, partial [Candidatus Falkowbacteria bacterium]|nr:response regulator [Candidatus Falkowbacteria bacterium]